MSRIEHLRHRDYDRTRHSSRFLEWLAVQAARLTVSARAVFSLLASGSSTRQIENYSTFTTPANTVVPTIVGTAKVGTQLTSTNGTWTGNPAPSFTYQWKAGGVAIAGATSSTYTPVAGDVGKTILLTVTGTNPKGSASASSVATAAVAA